MDVSPDQANRRQEHFLAQVRSSGALWTLMLANGLANWTEDDDLVIPLWDSELEALACAAMSFPGYQARSIELDELLDDWLPLLIERDGWLAIQPVASTAGNQIPARLLRSLLEGEGAQHLRECEARTVSRLPGPTGGHGK